MSRSTIRNIIISSVLFSVTGIAYFLMLHQVSVEGDRLGEEIDILQEHQAQEASYFKLIKIYESSKKDREELNNFFVLSESDSIDFLNEIEDTGSKLGVSINTNGVQTVTDSTDDSEWIEVDYTVKGSRERLQQFVQVLEQLPYVSRLVSLSMNGVTKTEWQANIKLQVKVLTYDE
ncbi:hypothetical protein H6784_03550 [Candidatus Nomurabacteria bacterium]|nr:hypothetical protein [Candidatus Nomurabacteria bacterium]